MKTFISGLTVQLLILSEIMAQGNPYVSEIIEYHPAPGQFINKGPWGIPERTLTLTDGDLDGGISLGGYGGYIILGFDHTIENDPGNPYGIDFTIFGNPLIDRAKNDLVIWSEPGIVMVMKDENGNGEADDTWYELAGSDYHFSSTVRDYKITYTNPGEPVAADVPWTDNQSNSGHVLANSHHSQPYYPLGEIFPSINQGEITFSGTMIQGYVNRSNPTRIESYKRGFGYVDNSPVNQGVTDHTTPDNPYTVAVEGAGGDAFDIDWAVDEEGNYVTLDGIDFIKIYTALNADAGWLGEISTEVRGAVDVAPNTSITGILDQVVLADIPLKVDVGAEIPLEAYAFHKGIIQKEASIEYTVNNPSLAEIRSGKLITLAPGEVQVIASLTSNPAVRYVLATEVIAPAGISITIPTQTIRVKIKQEISALVIDQNGRKIPGIPFLWSSSDQNILEIVQEDENLLINGKGEGSAWLKVMPEHIPELKDSVLIDVLPESVEKPISLTIKDQEGGIILSRRHASARNFDLNAYVDNPQQNYGIDRVGDVTVAHAIAQQFSNEAFYTDLRFRDDAKGDNGLYLWRVPKGDQSNVIYEFGYGGSTEPDYDNAWVVRVNQYSYVHYLDTILVNEGDEIVVYHQNDISRPWQFVHLTGNKDSVAIDEPVMIRIQQSEHSLGQNRSIDTLSSGFIENAEIRINGVVYEEGGEPLLTDKEGQATITFTTGGLKQVQVAGESIANYVRSNQVTSIGEVTDNLFSVFPNPFENTIRINTPGAGVTYYYQVIRLDGSIAFSGQAERQTNEIVIDSQSWDAGLYILQIRSGDHIEYFKLVKR